MAIHRFEPTHYHTTLAAREPVLRVADGDTIVTTTVDAGGRDYRGEQVTAGGNPQTGPFFIEGAEPGDTLAVHLDRLWPNRDHGYTAIPVAANVVDPWYVRKLPDGGRADWQIDREAGTATLVSPETRLGRLTLPLDPMLGCFGVAPPGGQAISTATSAEHGGNMDYRGFRSGVTVYFPVFEEGALLHVGDGHAVQGDGEIVGTGIEISFDVQVTVRVLKGNRIRWPRGENEEYVFARPLDQCVQHATTEMLRLLEDDYHLDPAGASLLVSAALLIAAALGVSAAAAVPKAAGNSGPSREYFLTPAELRHLTRKGSPEERRWMFLVASFRGELRAAKALLDAGVDVNTMMTGEDALNTDQPANKRFGSALFFATAAGDLPMARLLLARGARARAVNDDGETALHLFGGGMEDVSTRPSPHSSELLQALLAAGADLNAREKRGRTPLMVCAQNYRAECVRLLLSRGADLHLRDASGSTALHLAAAGPDDRSEMPHDWGAAAGKVVHILVARGADLNDTDRRGLTPLARARARRLYPVAAVLERLRTAAPSRPAVSRSHLPLAC